MESMFITSDTHNTVCMTSLIQVHYLKARGIQARHNILLSERESHKRNKVPLLLGKSFRIQECLKGTVVDRI